MSDRKFSLGRRGKQSQDPTSAASRNRGSNEQLSDQGSAQNISQKDVEETLLKEEPDVQEQWSTENAGIRKVKGWQSSAVASTTSESASALPDLLDTLEEVKESTSAGVVSVSAQALRALETLNTRSMTLSLESMAPPLFTHQQHLNLLATHGLVAKQTVLQETDTPWKFNEIMSEVMKKLNDAGAAPVGV